MKKNNTFQIVNARAATPAGVLENCTINIEGGIIADLGPDLTLSPGAIDVQGAFVLPGFIDLHCDAIEKEIETRPGSCLPVQMAVGELDKKMAAAGVTTIFHSLSFAEKEYAILRTLHMADRIIREVRDLCRYLTVDTRIHLRYEITNSAALPIIEELITGGCVDLVSIMDHTPGQGQFKTPEQFKKYYSSYYSMDEKEIEEVMEKRKAIQESVGVENARRIAAICRARAIPLASHDDDTVEKIDFIVDCGAVLSEFPVTQEALDYARHRRLMVAVGSPNIIRGESHNHNLSALDVIRKGGADIVCSDYVPSTLLHALFKIHHECRMPLHEVSRLFSHNPAKVMGMDHVKGQLAQGLDADMLVVDNKLPYPRIIKTYVKGREVYSSCLV
jgi:alpha-D-ribose 1-methylphosphonate 5-triphosphate diphosphatase